MGCPGLTIAGAAFEVAGLALLAWQITRIQRAEFGTPRFLQRLRNFFRPPLPQTIHAEGIASVSGGGNVTARGRRTSSASVEERLSSLEQQHADLERKVDESRKGLEARIAEINETVASVDASLKSAQNEQARKRRQDLRSTVHVQSVGTGLFFLGAVLSAAGNLVQC